MPLVCFSLPIIILTRSINLETKIRCPICGEYAEHKYYKTEYWVEEDYIDCKNCGYYYAFTHGNYIEEIGKYVIGWSYMTPYYLVNKRIGKLIRKARRNYKKHNKKTKDYKNKLGFYYGKRKKPCSWLLQMI